MSHTCTPVLVGLASLVSENQLVVALNHGLKFYSEIKIIDKRELIERETYRSETGGETEREREQQLKFRLLKIKL